MNEDYYAVLGVSPEADAPEIQSAVERALRLTQDSARRVLLRHIGEVLGNTARRAAYDHALKSGPRAPGSAPRQAPLEPDIPSKPAWRGWLAASVLALVVGGIGYQMGKPRVPSAPKADTAATPNPAQLAPAMTALSPTTDVKQTGAAPSSGTALSPEALYASVAPSVLVVESLNASGQAVSRGSAVVIGADMVVTNCHVVQSASAVRVRSGASELSAQPDTSDTYLDLCLMRVPGLNLPAVRRGSVGQVRVGQTVFAIGTPHDLERTLSQGLVSALRETPDGTLIQTSASISPGSSGGGLFDTEGRLIGITTFQHRLGQNLNFALPVDFLDLMRNR